MSCKEAAAVECRMLVNALPLRKGKQVRKVKFGIEAHAGTNKLHPGASQRHTPLQNPAYLGIIVPCHHVGQLLLPVGCQHLVT